MAQYKNLSGRSNVESYEIHEDTITVRFMSGSFRNYLYDSRSPGSVMVEEMKQLAEAGIGLNSYISTVVKSRYSRKW